MPGLAPDSTADIRTATSLPPTLLTDPFLFLPALVPLAPPGIKIANSPPPDYPPYLDGLAKGVFVRGADGQPYVGQVGRRGVRNGGAGGLAVQGGRACACLPCPANAEPQPAGTGPTAGVGLQTNRPTLLAGC